MPMKKTDPYINDFQHQFYYVFGARNQLRNQFFQEKVNVVFCWNWNAKRAGFSSGIYRKIGSVQVGLENLNKQLLKF